MPKPSFSVIHTGLDSYYKVTQANNGIVVGTGVFSLDWETKMVTCPTCKSHEAIQDVPVISGKIGIDFGKIDRVQLQATLPKLFTNRPIQCVQCGDIKSPADFKPGKCCGVKIYSLEAATGTTKLNGNITQITLS